MLDWKKPPDVSGVSILYKLSEQREKERERSCDRRKSRLIHPRDKKRSASSEDAQLYAASEVKK